jgi:NAD dependent epimerase/dehydratase
MDIKSGDIRDPFFCQSLCKDIDIVFNLAALIAIPYSYEAPNSYINTNITGTLNLLESARNSTTKQFIQISTSEVYGTAQYVPIDEAHPLQPQSPYSASKIASDSIAMSYYNSFGIPVTIARPFNTYGPRQSARAVIPTIITQIASGASEIKLGDVSPTRDFNFVIDTCEALFTLIDNEKCIGKTINIGSNSEHSVLETVNLIKEIMKSNVEITYDEQRIRPEKSEVHRLVCDNTLLKSLTGYNHQFDLKAGLSKTIEWFSKKENLELYKADKFNV